MDDTVNGTRAEQLRRALVDEVRGYGAIRSASVEHAMRTVPRHTFLPGVSMEKAYSDEIAVTHRDDDGVAVSSASAPGIVAMLLEQLDVRPGHRILEIGTGTGYNAALLAHLTGPTGAVTTVEIMADAAQSARTHLDAAGYSDVSVIVRDGEFGHSECAPYDRIIVTAGAWDLPPAWADQLARGGRIVVPLRMRGLTRSVAFERGEGFWQSRSIIECGFIPMRGVGHVAERVIQLGEGAGVEVRLDDGQSTDTCMLEGALGQPPTVVWTGNIASQGTFDHLDFWLATLDGFCRFIMRRPVSESGIVAPMHPWGSMGVIDRRGLAYLTTRPTDTNAEGKWSPPELGICAYGVSGDRLVQAIMDRVQAWGRAIADMQELWIEAHPAGNETRLAGQFVIDKRHSRIVVRTR